MNIVQIGTNRAFDTLSSIVKSYPSDKIDMLLMVEPFNYHNKSIKDCYEQYSDKLFIENIAIVPEAKENNVCNIYYHPLDKEHTNAYELASLKKTHSLKIRDQYNKKDIVEMTVPCLTINQLIAKYHLSKIDILYIDTEGFDDQIIYSINFHNISINTIYYENLHIDKNTLQKFLKEKNYEITEQIEIDPYSDKATILKA